MALHPQDRCSGAQATSTATGGNYALNQSPDCCSLEYSLGLKPKGRVAYGRRGSWPGRQTRNGNQCRKWIEENEGDCGHIGSHFDAPESPAVHLGVAAGCFTSSISVGPTALYLKLKRFSVACVERRVAGAHQLQNRKMLGEQELRRGIIARFETKQYNAAFEELLGLKDNGTVNAWKRVPAVDTVWEIVCRASKGVLVGQPLCTLVPPVPANDINETTSSTSDPQLNNVQFLLDFVVLQLGARHTPFHGITSNRSVTGDD
ncbi:hypothetical protein EDD15DRAFT_2521410 [Pisolithus albus]|nr:hypothetical protein EDD15DRAFT_2521410 [Pisolithus albus]